MRLRREQTGLLGGKSEASVSPSVKWTQGTFFCQAGDTPSKSQAIVQGGPREGSRKICCLQTRSKFPTAPGPPEILLSHPIL